MVIDYSKHLEKNLSGRYVTLDHIAPILDQYKDVFEIKELGYSENNNPIPALKIGYGNHKILIWSQMHGNESTTTKAIFDLLKFLNSEEELKKQVLKKCTLYIIPILNPDGAQTYTRVNYNNVDLNRDARDLSQAESLILRNAFEGFRPNLCLNMHDQRTIFAAGHKNNPASVSFLSPAADAEKTINEARKVSMRLIVSMFKKLQHIIPGQIGRYDDSFNKACVGDYFQSQEAPTILFEAGHVMGDYEREVTREYIFHSLLYLLDEICNPSSSLDYLQYFNIPENTKRARDILIKNARISGVKEMVTIAIQFDEKLINEKIIFHPIIESIDSGKGLFGYKEINAQGENVSLPDNSIPVSGKLVQEILISGKIILLK